MEITNNLGLKCPEQNETFDVEHMNDNMRILDEIWKVIYPVGSLYISTNAASPQDLFGGTWVQLENRFLLGAGSSYTAGDTGGAATHALTVAQMPEHRHSFGGMPTDKVSGSYVVARSVTFSDQGGDTGYTAYSGSGSAHNNMPPYLVVYMWERTA